MKIFHASDVMPYGLHSAWASDSMLQRGKVRLHLLAKVSRQAASHQLSVGTTHSNWADVIRTLGKGDEICLREHMVEPLRCIARCNKIEIRAQCLEEFRRCGVARVFAEVLVMFEPATVRPCGCSSLRFQDRPLDYRDVELELLPLPPSLRRNTDRFWGISAVRPGCFACKRSIAVAVSSA
jgi:hypothetical protein